MAKMSDTDKQKWNDAKADLGDTQPKKQARAKPRAVSLRYDAERRSKWLKDADTQTARKEAEQRAKFQRDAANMRRELARQIVFIKGELPGIKYGKATVNRLQLKMSELYRMLESSKGTPEDRQRAAKLLRDIREKQEQVSNREWRAKLEEIKDVQAHQFDKYAQDLQTFKADLKDSFKSTVSNLGSRLFDAIDNVGVGPLTLGNAARTVGAVGRGAASVYRGAKWLGGFAAAAASDKLAQVRAHGLAQNQATGGVGLPGKAEPVSSLSSKLLGGSTPDSDSVEDNLAQGVNDTRVFRRKLLNALEEHNDSLKDANKSARRRPSLGRALTGILTSAVMGIKGMLVAGVAKIGALIAALGIGKALAGLGKGLASVFSSKGALAGHLARFFGPASTLAAALAPLAALYAVAKWAEWAQQGENARKLTEEGSLLDATSKAVGGTGLKPVADKSSVELLDEQTTSRWWEFGKTDSAKKRISSDVERGRQWTSDEAAVIKKNLGIDVPVAAPVVPAASPLDSAPAPSSVPGALTGSAPVGSIDDHFNTSRADTSGIQPPVAANLSALGAEYQSLTGKTPVMTSAYRDPAEQAVLYQEYVSGKRSTPVAPPGRSLHNYGVAVDIASADANKMDQLGLLDKYGFSRPIASEKWHVQPVGMSLAAAKSGVYSADSPTNQGSSAVPVGAQVASTGRESAPGVSAPQAVGQPFQVAPQFEQAEAQASTQPSAGHVHRPAGGPSSQEGIATIPQFSTVDGTLLALNLNALAGSA